MTHEFKTTRRVEFSETDMAGIVHFSNFFRYMEATEHEFFRALGVSLHVEREEGMSGWARVNATCDYHRPARYEDLLEIVLSVLEKTSKSLRYSFSFRVMDEATGSIGEPIATGGLTVVHVAKAPGEARMRAADMPPAVAERITVAPR